MLIITWTPFRHGDDVYFPVKTKSASIMSSGDTRQPRGVTPTTSCAIQRWHITVYKVVEHLGECLPSSAAVTPAIGQSGDARWYGWRDGGAEPNGGRTGGGVRGGESRCRWKKRQWQIQERGGKGGAEGWKQGEEQRQGTQRVFRARLRVLSEGKDDTVAATQARRPSNQSVTARQGRTHLSHSMFR